MTENNGPGPDWDEELADLIDGVLDDAPVEVDPGLPGGAGADGAGDGAGWSGGPGGPGDGDMSGDGIAGLLAERTADLQRLQAEYVNYKRRVDRDRDVARQRGIEAVLSDLLPVLDGIDAARAHGELGQGAAMLADELAKVTGKYGLSAYGLPGEPFDPHVHEALMHINQPGFPPGSVSQVFQRGYALGGRVIRPARVGVCDGEPAGAADQPTGSDTVSPGDGAAGAGGGNAGGPGGDVSDAGGDSGAATGAGGNAGGPAAAASPTDPGSGAY